MQVCVECGSEFAIHPLINGDRMDLRGRKRCLECKPLRRLRKARRKVPRATRRKICEACGQEFSAKAVIDGRIRSLYHHRFCFTCSSFGSHNTSKTPPRIAGAEELREHRRRRRNAKTYRAQKRRRSRRKLELVAARGGRCEDCGYSRCPAALEFHHRDASTKEFGVGGFDGSPHRLLAEIQKCDLLCANCHRVRHAGSDGASLDGRVVYDRDRKARAVALMGGACFECERDGPSRLFEFHHWDAGTKTFGISQSGISSRNWQDIVAELEKCVMLCANCHREVHAGVRTIRPTLLGLAEDVAPYAA